MRLSKVSFAFDIDVFAIITYFRKNYTFSKKWGNANLSTSTGNMAKNLEMIVTIAISSFCVLHFDNYFNIYICFFISFLQSCVCERKISLHHKMLITIGLSPNSGFFKKVKKTYTPALLNVTASSISFGQDLLS